MARKASRSTKYTDGAMGMHLRLPTAVHDELHRRAQMQQRHKVDLVVDALVHHWGFKDLNEFFTLAQDAQKESA